MQAQNHFEASRVFKIWFLLATLLISGCEKDGPSPDFTKAISIQQAPFGTDTVQVKLKSISDKGILNNSFFYKDGYLDLTNIHYTVDSLQVIATIVSNHIDGNIQTTLVRRPEIVSVEQGYVSSNWIDLGLLTFEAPSSDSIRTVKAEKNYFNNPDSKYVFTFNKAGFIVNKQGTFPTAPVYNYNEVYFRDRSNNVVAMVYDMFGIAGSESGASTTNIEYDSHPNPFFKLGFYKGSFLTIECLSPNNMLKSTEVRGDGSIFTSHYSYEYFANGYPKKVEIKHTYNGKETDSVESFEYNYY